MAETKKTKETTNGSKEQNKDNKKDKKGLYDGLNGAFNKNKKIGLYDDKKEDKKEDVNKTWMPGKTILYRKYEKGQDIEYDSDPENKKKDDKSHIHTAELMKVEYAKSSILTKDKVDGAYCSYPVNTIKIKLPPKTKENTIIPPIQPQSDTFDTSNYNYHSAANYKKTRKEAPDPPSEDKPIERIDFGLNLYYEEMGRKDYKNKDGNGKFVVFLQDNGIDGDQIKDEFELDANDCTLVDLDEDFPLKQDNDNKDDDNKDDDDVKMDKNTRNQKIYDIIQHCYKYGYPAGHPDYEYVNRSSWNTSHTGYHNNNNNGNYYGGYKGGSYGHHGGYYHEPKEEWDPNIEYILPPQKEDILKDEQMIDTFGGNDDDENNNNKEEEEEEEEESNDPRPKKPVIEIDGKEEDISSASELYSWDDEPAECKKMGGLERIDNGLRIYYEKLGRRNYQNEAGIGKFLEYVEDNGLDDDDIMEEFEVGAEDCTFIEYVGPEDEDKFKFPLSIKTDNVDVVKEKIYRLIKYCHQHAAPPISHVNDADISLLNGYIRQEVEEKLNILIPIEILEIIREHYPSAAFFFSFDDDWSLSVSKEDILETKRIIKKQLRSMVEETDLADLLPVITMGRKNNHFPLMQYLFDGYVRNKIKIFLKFGYGTKLFNCQPESWLLKYPFCNKLKSKDPPSFQYLLKGLKQYNYAKLFPCIVPMSLSIRDRKQIRDDLYKIFYYISGCIKWINSFITGRITPFQFDFTIIVNKIFQNDGKVWKDHKTPILTIKKDVVGVIKDRLTKNKCCFIEKVIKNDDIIDTEYILNQFKETYEEYKNKIIDEKRLKSDDDYPKRWRFCCTVDRRKDDGDLFYIYEPKIASRETEKERCCHKLPGNPSEIDEDLKHLISEIYHMNSMECLVPGDDHGSDIRTRLSHGISLCFHAPRNNQIKCYLWWDNSFMRFMPKDINTLMPVWFEEDHKDNKKFKDDQEIAKQVEKLTLKDLHFVDFLKSWTLGKKKKNN